MDYRMKMEMVRQARMGGDEGMEPESRRRRGRNGRFIRNEYDAEMYGAYDNYDPYERYESPEMYPRQEYRGNRMAYEPRGHHMMPEREMPTMGKIGFAKQPGKLTWEMAQEWVYNLKSKSGKGPKWEFEHIKKLMEQQKIHGDPIEFWAVINALHSDYGEVLKKYGVNTLDAYIDLTKAWLNDEDAVDDKALTYFECIVK